MEKEKNEKTPSQEKTKQKMIIVEIYIIHCLINLYHSSWCWVVVDVGSRRASTWNLARSLIGKETD